ncbi:hypothetical protein SK128_012499, partial [Halocaridina rubra]
MGFEGDFLVSMRKNLQYRIDECQSITQSHSLSGWCHAKSTISRGDAMSDSQSYS